MGSPADYLIIAIVSASGLALWIVLDRLAALRRDLDAIKRKLDAS